MNVYLAQGVLSIALIIESVPAERTGALPVDKNQKVRYFKAAGPSE